MDECIQFGEEDGQCPPDALKIPEKSSEHHLVREEPISPGHGASTWDVPDEAYAFLTSLVQLSDEFKKRLTGGCLYCF